ncbi:regulator, partial [Cronobacter sakazakii]|uniref:regulator n=2 Tax=Enterobacteriaceae TaxID=543 RepID=UPI00097780F2
MTTHITISLPVPSISKEKYMELTGLSEDTVDSMLKDGRLPRHRLRKDMGREKIMINIAAMTVTALSDC